MTTSDKENPGHLKSGLGSSPLARCKAKNLAGDNLALRQAAVKAKSCQGGSDPALHIQHILLLLQWGKLKIWLNHIQSPLAWSKHAWNPKASWDLPDLLASESSQSAPSCLDPGKTPLARQVIDQRKTAIKASMVCLPLHPHLQTAILGTQPNKYLVGEPPKMFQDKTSIVLRFWYGTPSPWMPNPIVCSGSPPQSLHHVSFRASTFAS